MQISTIMSPVLESSDRSVPKAQQKSCLKAVQSSSFQRPQLSLLTTNTGTMLCDKPNSLPRSGVSFTYWGLVIETPRRHSHPNIPASLRLVADRRIWAPMNKDVCM